MNLAQYLSQLDVPNSQYALYVDPENLDDYRIGEICFENGGVLDDKIFVATLESLCYERDEYCGSDEERNEMLRQEWSENIVKEIEREVKLRID